MERGLLRIITALLPHTCRGKADRKVPKDIIGNRGLGLLGFAPVAWSCLGLVGRAWVCLKGAWVCLGFASVCSELLGIAWARLGWLGFVWVSWGFLGIAWVCLGLLGLAWDCFGLLGLAWLCFGFAWACSGLLEFGPAWVCLGLLWLARFAVSASLGPGLLKSAWICLDSLGLV